MQYTLGPVSCVDGLRWYVDNIIFKPVFYYVPKKKKNQFLIILYFILSHATFQTEVHDAEGRNQMCDLGIVA